jgi:hypothetical protein
MRFVKFKNFYLGIESARCAIILLLVYQTFLHKLKSIKIECARKASALVDDFSLTHGTSIRLIIVDSKGKWVISILVQIM